MPELIKTFNWNVVMTMFVSSIQTLLHLTEWKAHIRKIKNETWLINYLSGQGGMTLKKVFFSLLPPLATYAVKVRLLTVMLDVAFNPAFFSTQRGLIFAAMNSPITAWIRLQRSVCTHVYSFVLVYRNIEFTVKSKCCKFYVQGVFFL